MDYNKILQLAKQFLYCPVCKNHFDNDHIFFKGYVNDKFIIKTDCDKSHPLVHTIFISKILNKSSVTELELETITQDEYLDIRNSINKFDGNFEKIF